MTRLVRGALLVALMCGAAAPLHAQGGLLRKIGEKASAAKDAAKRGVQEAAGEKAGVPAATSNGDQAAKPRTVEFTDNVLQITGPRVDAMLAGMEAEAAARPGVEQQHAAAMAKYEAAVAAYDTRLAAYDRERRAWDAKKESWDSCVDRANEAAVAAERGDTKTRDLEKRAEAVMSDEEKQARLEALAERMQAAQARGDQKAMMAINDTLQRELKGFMDLGRESMAASQRSQARSADAQAAAKKCGTMPPEPKAPESPNSLYPKGASEQVTAAGAKAAKLTSQQYAVLKERVQAYVCANGRFGRYTNWAYTAEEIALLDERLKTLPGCERFRNSANWQVGA